MTKNVLCLIKGLGLGGAEMLLPMALPYVNKSCYTYHVGYFLPWKDDLVESIEANDVQVSCFSSGNRVDVLAVVRVVRYIREKNISLIHAHLPYPGLVARLAGRITGTPVVYTEHNVWERLHPLTRWANKWTFNWNTVVIAVSEQVAKSMKGVSHARLRVIENGIDCAKLSAPQNESASVRTDLGISADDFVIGKVANLSVKKNHENLIDAFAEVFKVKPEAKLLLVGQFVGRDIVLRQRAEALGIIDRVIFTGARTDIPQLLRLMDVFVISSDFEGLPIAMLEAMAVGIPVVATTVGGIPSVLRNGKDGYLVLPQNAPVLADAILKLVKNPTLRQQMGENACQRVFDEFDIVHMVTQVEQVYEELLNDA